LVRARDRLAAIPPIGNTIAIPIRSVARISHAIAVRVLLAGVLNQGAVVVDVVGPLIVVVRVAGITLQSAVSC